MSLVVRSLNFRIISVFYVNKTFWYGEKGKIPAMVTIERINKELAKNEGVEQEELPPTSYWPFDDEFNSYTYAVYSLAVQKDTEQNEKCTL